MVSHKKLCLAVKYGLDRMFKDKCNALRVRIQTYRYHVECLDFASSAGRKLQGLDSWLQQNAYHIEAWRDFAHLCITGPWYVTGVSMSFVEKCAYNWNEIIMVYSLYQSRRLLLLLAPQPHTRQNFY